MNFDLLSAFVGCLVGLAAGMVICRCRRNPRGNGELNISAGIIRGRDGDPFTWGFRAGGGVMALDVPINLEIENTGKIQRELRDVSLVLYKDGVPVGDMEQIMHGDQDTCCVFVPGKQKKRFDFCFHLVKDPRAPQYFDQIVLRYYDERKRKRLLPLGNFDGNWRGREFPDPGDRIQLCRDGVPCIAKKLSMGEEKLMFLQLIQEPITRMSTTSAIFKGFAATIVAGILALSGSDLNAWVMGTSLVLVLVFACLDMYYLKMEKGFRYLYDEVRLDLKDVDFRILPYADGINKNHAVRKAAKISLGYLVKSISIWPFYLIMLAIVGIFLVKCTGVF